MTAQLVLIFLFYISLYFWWSLYSKSKLDHKSITNVLLHYISFILYLLLLFMMQKHTEAGKLFTTY